MPKKKTDADKVVTLDRKKLIAAIATAGAVVDSRSALPALSCVLVTAFDDRVTVIGQDGTVTVMATSMHDTGLKDDESIALCVSPRALLDRLKVMADTTVTVSVEAAGQVHIGSRGSKRAFTVLGMPASEYPDVDFAWSQDAEPIVVRGPELVSLLSSVSSAASDDFTRPHINGVLFEATGDKLRAVATDGHQLSLCELARESGPDMRGIVPLRAVDVITKALAADERVMVYMTRERMLVEGAAVSVCARLPDVEFPPYQQVIPKDDPRRLFEVPRAGLVDSLKALSGIDKMNKSIKMTVSGGIVGLRSESPDAGNGTDEVACGYEGSEELRIGFAGYKLITALESFAGDDALLQVTGELDPILIKPKSGSFVGVVMPMRV